MVHLSNIEYFKGLYVMTNQNDVEMLPANDIFELYGKNVPIQNVINNLCSFIARGYTHVRMDLNIAEFNPDMDEVELVFTKEKKKSC